jgi:primosomal protein N' (replication factor Y)
MSHQISVMVHTPAHSGIGGALTYESDAVHAPGTLVRVPLGSRELLGVVWEVPKAHAENGEAAPLENPRLDVKDQPSLLMADDPSHQNAAPATMQLRAIASVLEGLTPLSAHCSVLRSRSWLGSAANATSPALRW